MAAARNLVLAERRGGARPRMLLFENLPAAVGQRDGARIVLCLIDRAGVDQGDALRRQIGRIARGEQGGQRFADRAAAADCDIEVRRHAAFGIQCFMTASISVTVFGASELRMSQPSAVTSASSSMRMPMFQNCSGTPSAGRT